MDTYNRLNKAARKILNHLVEGEPCEEFDKLNGLCANLEEIDNCLAIHAAAREHFISWKHCSGDKTYPVPADSVYDSPEDEYNRGHHYRGKQLALRVDLLEHIIEQTSVEIK